jgi:hypothetical protein
MACMLVAVTIAFFDIVNVNWMYSDISQCKVDHVTQHIWISFIWVRVEFQHTIGAFVPGVLMVECLQSYLFVGGTGISCPDSKKIVLINISQLHWMTVAIYQNMCYCILNVGKRLCVSERAGFQTRNLSFRYSITKHRCLGILYILGKYFILTHSVLKMYNRLEILLQ